MTEAEKRRKKRELERKIRKLEGKIKEAEKLQEDFEDCEKEINTSGEDWRDGRARFLKSQIARQVVVNDLFEGVIAERLSQDIPDVMLLMNRTVSKMDELKKKISRQVKKLEEYIKKLEKEKRALERQLAAL
ncbi:MAG: hypothetical protein GX234_03850 [Clostridiales bacterium]|nr:hypothetical protein [Clostridiales bacterium]